MRVKQWKYRQEYKFKLVNSKQDEGIHRWSIDLYDLTFLVVITIILTSLLA